MKKIVAVRFRIDFKGICSIGHGKIELLEKIARLGSLSQAAREMGMSYRRAWLLVASMNAGFDKPVTIANIGGSGGGGAAITPFGLQLIASYRKLESELLALTARHMRPITPHVPKTEGQAVGRLRSSPRKK